MCTKTRPLRDLCIGDEVVITIGVDATRTCPSSSSIFFVAELMVAGTGFGRIPGTSTQSLGVTLDSALRHVTFWLGKMCHLGVVSVLSESGEALDTVRDYVLYFHTDTKVKVNGVQLSAVRRVILRVLKEQELTSSSNTPDRQSA